MKTKDEIIQLITNDAHWTDQDRSRKAHQIDFLIEVLIDIRDILDNRLLDLDSDLDAIFETLKKQLKPFLRSYRDENKR